MPRGEERARRPWGEGAPIPPPTSTPRDCPLGGGETGALVTPPPLPHQGLSPHTPCWLFGTEEGTLMAERRPHSLTRARGEGRSASLPPKTRLHPGSSGWSEHGCLSNSGLKASGPLSKTFLLSSDRPRLPKPSSAALQRLPQREGLGLLHEHAMFPPNVCGFLSIPTLQETGAAPGTRCASRPGLSGPSDKPAGRIAAPASSGVCGCLGL